MSGDTNDNDQGADDKDMTPRATAVCIFIDLFQSASNEPEKIFSLPPQLTEPEKNHALSSASALLSTMSMCVIKYGEHDDLVSMLAADQIDVDYTSTYLTDKILAQKMAAAQRTRPPEQDEPADAPAAFEGINDGGDDDPDPEEWETFGPDALVVDVPADMDRAALRGFVSEIETLIKIRLKNEELLVLAGDAEKKERAAGFDVEALDDAVRENVGRWFYEALADIRCAIEKVPASIDPQQARPVAFIAPGPV